MKYHRFYKTNTGKWYIDYPSYIESGGQPEMLEMVMGADTMLLMLAMGEDEVDVSFDTEPFEGADTLTLTHLGADEGGAYYTCDSVMGLPYAFPVWLCDVTLHVFGHFPPVIYFR